MASFVMFHAHPDDESIATGGTMARAVAEGHRVTLVVATGGEVGEVDDGFLDEGETLGERRRKETDASAEILGIHRVEFLGYRDSGMIDEPTNDHADCFWQADVAEAAKRLGHIIDDENAAVLTAYDNHGGYGHPDHIQVHRVAHAAAASRPDLRLYEATFDRDRMKAMVAASIESGSMSPDDAPTDVDEMGSPAAQITTEVDVAAFIVQKRDSMRAHASQIGDESPLLAMPDDAFAAAFGLETFIEVGREPGPERGSWLLDHS